MKTIFQTLLLCIFISISNHLTAQEDKTVEITTTGPGKTKEIALHNALRSAIEQAFGVFISSKTEVLNDQLLTDQIISVSNGNIQHYDLISEMPIDDNTSFAVTVKSKVSISKLTSFIESKGIEVEFKGAVFAMNIKQQKLNEESELKAIKEMAAILKNIADRSFDFEVAADGEPTASNNNADDWNIPLTVRVKLNNNFENYKSYFQKTLGAITMTEVEANNYINLKKPIYSVMLRNQIKTIDTLLVKTTKDRYKDLYKNYLLDSMNCLKIIVRGKYNGFESYNFTSSSRQLTLTRNVASEKDMKGWLSLYGLDKSDTIRIKVLPGVPLYNVYYLRNMKSSIEIQKLVFYFAHAIQNFILDDGAKKYDFQSIYSLTYKKDNNYWLDIFNVSITNPAESINSPENLWSSILHGKKYNATERTTISSIKPYNEENFSDSDFPTFNYSQINNVIPKFDLTGRHEFFYNRKYCATTSQNFMESGALFHPLFPGLSTIQYNYNNLLQNSKYNIVLQFNQLCNPESHLVAYMKFNDVKSLTELNKLNGYKIYPKR